MPAGSSGVSEDRRLFAEEMRALRKKMGWSQEETGARINFSASTIANIETCHRAPTAEQARLLDEAFGSPGTLQRWERRIRGVPFSADFRPFAPHEAEATTLKIFEHTLIPGLFQTENYARLVMLTYPGRSVEDVAALVAARMERQAILDRRNPPWLWAVLDEQVLRRDVGRPEVMHAQLTKVAEFAGRPKVTIQVIPADRLHSGLNGAFGIAENMQPPAVVYLEGAEGQTVENAETAEKLTVLFDSLRAEALPSEASRTLIEEEAQRWKERITS